MELSGVDAAETGGKLERLIAQAREMGIVEEVLVEGDMCQLTLFDFTYSCSRDEAIETLEDAIEAVGSRRARRVE